MVVDGTFTHGVDRRTAIDRVTRFEVGERATYLVVVKNTGASRPVIIEWSAGGTVVGHQTLTIGTSRGWRTWALHTVRAADAASGIDVRVLDSAGNILHADHVEVRPGSDLAV